ncbi:MAG: dCTP deaminase [Crenarchaeota archaeon]|nr:dCTP deaminase [Thermoproteota archaeon]MCR8454113.1 dCTP deaminase [Thermoproteota archaeon]MCR8455399.1 dCTP deaminase [Thermoproteota archaeon]MCR8463277.1 dCTP deaminase [Thermoproteota archaeon]MCR8471240.1 dCTP deaminase [Thermoproteota archaeon]
MLLSDRTIIELIRKGEIIIDPFDEALIGPSSVDLRLGNDFLMFDRKRIEAIDPRNPVDDFLEHIHISDEEFIVLHPGHFVIATTLEYIKLPSYISARIEGRSSLARLGLVIHSTGGFIDAGFEGTLTLEMTNVNTVPIKLYPKMKVAQIAFILQDKPSMVPYNQRKSSKYVGQRGAVPSRIYLDFSQTI